MVCVGKRTASRPDGRHFALSHRKQSRWTTVLPDRALLRNTPLRGSPIKDRQPNLCFPEARCTNQRLPPVETTSDSTTSVRTGPEQNQFCPSMLALRNES